MTEHEPVQDVAPPGAPSTKASLSSALGVAVALDLDGAMALLAPGFTR